jgi:hypothetical protein
VKKTFGYRLRFTEATIRAAIQKFTEKTDGQVDRSPTLTVATESGEWSHDSLEEFFGDYRSGGAGHVLTAVPRGDLNIFFDATRSLISVSLSTRDAVEAVFAIFEAGRNDATPLNPSPTEVTVFIGHGRSPQWRDLQDHLRDQHGIVTAAFESGARVGHEVRDVLEDMLGKTSLALLVLTAEDEAAAGAMRARQNVVHELGLFQGKLGFTRAIALVEEGVELFSNLDGIQQIRYPGGRIRETFGDVLGVIRREFR